MGWFRNDIAYAMVVQSLWCKYWLVIWKHCQLGESYFLLLCFLLLLMGTCYQPYSRTGINTSTNNLPWHSFPRIIILLRTHFPNLSSWCLQSRQIIRWPFITRLSKLCMKFIRYGSCLAHWTAIQELSKHYSDLYTVSSWNALFWGIIANVNKTPFL